MIKRSSSRRFRFVEAVAGFLLTATIILATGLMSVASFAQPGGTCGDGVSWTLDSDGTLTISGSGEISNYGIPTNPDAIQAPWLDERDSIKAVVVEDGVTRIGENAFYGCASIKTATLKGSIGSIGAQAFSNCSSLESVDLGRVKSIGNNVFIKCDKLKSLKLPDSIESLQYYAFSGNATELYYYGTRNKWDTFGVRDVEEDRRIHCLTSVTSTANPPEGGVTSIHYYDDESGQPCVTLTATPNDGYVFVNWTGDKSGTSLELSFGVAFDDETSYDLTANFKSKPKLTITARDQTYVYNGNQQGEGDAAYEDAAEIEKKVKVEGLLDGDHLTSVVLTGTTETEVGVYPDAIEVTGFVINGDTDYAASTYEVTLVPGKLIITKPQYTVKFVNWDGTELQSESVAYGEMPQYKGDKPTKKADDKYTYKFKGWDPEVVSVTGEATYTATYEAVPIQKATLTFDLAGGTLDGKTGKLTVQAKVGDTIKLPGAPTRKGYTFQYWKGSQYEAGASYKVKGDHTFTASWKKDSASKPSEKGKTTTKTLPKTGDPFVAAAIIETCLAGMGASLAIAGMKKAKRRR